MVRDGAIELDRAEPVKSQRVDLRSGATDLPLSVRSGRIRKPGVQLCPGDARQLGDDQDITRPPGARDIHRDLPAQRAGIG